MRGRWGFSSFLLLVLAGCTMAPRYMRPEMPVRNVWAAEGSKPEGTAAGDLHWQDVFTDATQREVITLAVAHNRDLRMAALHVEKAQALFRIQRSDLTPAVGVMATGQRYRFPERMASDGKASIKEQDTVQVGLLSWELDFFGRVRSLKDRALNQYLATEQAQAAAQIALVAAVAQGYLLCAADREALHLAEATLTAQQAFHDLIARSRALGVASELELAQARSQREAARGELARLKGQMALDRNALELLVGTPLPERLLPGPLGAVAETKELSVRLPSEVLLERPDIRSAEHLLRAANANIGAARAAFFPRITLTAGAGSMSPDIAGLFDAGTRTWSFSPQLVAPLFAGGSLRANLRAAQADRDLAVAQYEKAIQTAFREVSDGLVRRSSMQEQLEAQRSLVEALDTSHRLSTARYQNGLDGYLGVLVAQRALYAAQQGLVTARLAYRVNQITLFKALGGRM